VHGTIIKDYIVVLLGIHSLFWKVWFILKILLFIFLNIKFEERKARQITRQLSGYYLYWALTIPVLLQTWILFIFNHDMYLYFAFWVREEEIKDKNVISYYDK
jgi:hypothetical protein